MDNPNCGMCGHMNMRGFCNLTACPFPAVKTDFVDFKKPKTNADRIRSMTDDELAEYFMGVADCPLPYQYKYCPNEDKTCLNCWLNWLKQEVKQ